MLLNPFAIVDNNIIHISEVNKDDVWNTYTCPECGEPLIARTGKVNTWHFAHKSLSKCKFGLSNESIGESPIHRYAKRIIKESAYVAAPKTYDGTKRHIFLKSTKEEYSSGERVVDVLAISKENEEIAIEIFYKHKVDEQKIQDLKNRFFIVMEIKIPDNLEDLSNIEKFKEGVLKTYPRAWIVLDKTTTYYKDDFYARKGIEIRKKIAEIQIQNNKLKIQEDNLKRKERALKREHEDIEEEWDRLGAWEKKLERREKTIENLEELEKYIELIEKSKLELMNLENREKKLYIELENKEKKLNMEFENKAKEFNWDEEYFVNKKMELVKVENQINKLKAKEIHIKELNAEISKRQIKIQDLDAEIEEIINKFKRYAIALKAINGWASYNRVDLSKITSGLVDSVTINFPEEQNILAEDIIKV